MKKERGAQKSDYNELPPMENVYAEEYEGIVPQLKGGSQAEQQKHYANGWNNLWN